MWWLGRMRGIPGAEHISMCCFTRGDRASDAVRDVRGNAFRDAASFAINAINASNWGLGGGGIREA